MPTYQYACTDCDHSFEQVQSFSEDSLTICPACQGRLRKIFNAVGVVFKGSGFYRTDSRPDSRTDSKNGSSGSTAGSTTGSGAGSDTTSSTGSSGSTSSSPSSSTASTPTAAGAA